MSEKQKNGKGEAQEDFEGDVVSVEVFKWFNLPPRKVGIISGSTAVEGRLEAREVQGLTPWCIVPEGEGEKL